MYEKMYQVKTTVTFAVSCKWKTLIYGEFDAENIVKNAVCCRRILLAYDGFDCEFDFGSYERNCLR